MSESTTTTENKRLVFSSQYNKVANPILEILAILNDIQLHQHFILNHALRASMLDVAVNLLRIAEEAEGMDKAITKIKTHLHRLYETTLQDIYSTQEADEEMATNGKNKHQVVRLRPHKIKRRKPRPMYRGSGKRNGKG